MSHDQPSFSPYSPAGVTDHGLLTGLSDDDHPQYHDNARALVWLATRSTSDLPEGSSLYFTEARVRSTPLTGLSISGGSINSTDSVLIGLGKLQNQINALVGGVNYQGTWNASTNSPSLVSSVGTKGYYYVVSTAGSTSLDGITDWKLGDWVIFNGTVWEKVDNTDAVLSVNGYTGAVSLVTTDVNEGTNLYFTDPRAVSAVAAADPYLLNTGDIGTGVYDFGGATSFEIPNSTTQTPAVDGQIALDTLVTDFTGGLLKYYSGALYGVVAMPIAQFTSPTDGYLVSYNATSDTFVLVAPPSGSSGITINSTTITSGIDTCLLFQDGTVVSEDTLLFWNKTSKYLNINGVRISQPTSGTLYVGDFPASITAPNNGAAYGFGAARYVTTGSLFYAGGYRAGEGATTQIGWVGIGGQCFVNACGTRDFALGFSTQANNSGTDTFAAGSVALAYATSDTGSIYMGTNVASGATTSFFNIVGGDASGAALANSYGSVIWGARAGQTAGGGFNFGRHVILGYLADAANGIGLTIAIGAGAVTSTANTCLIGGTIAAITSYYFGLAEQNATPLNVILRAGGGTGTNVSGAKMTLASGLGTGNAPENPVVIATPTVGTTGTALQTLAARINVYSKYSNVLNRLEESRGADVASANDLTLGNDGNFFVITGTTTINGIATLNWVSGSRVTLMFTGALTVKHNTAPSGGFAKIKLHGAVDLVTVNGDMIDLRYDGTNWRQTSPVSNTGA